MAAVRWVLSMNVVETKGDGKLPPSTNTTTPDTNPEPYTSIVNAGPFTFGAGDTEWMTRFTAVEPAWGPPPHPS